MAEQDYYELLQVHPKADAEAITAAYNRLRDRYADERLAGAADDLVALANERRAQLDQAHATLTNPKQRAAYDATLARAQRPAIADDDDEALDYRPLPAAGGRERGNGAAPRRSPTRQNSGRRVDPGRPAWLLPVGAVLAILALVSGIALALTGGGAAPPAPAPTTVAAAATETPEEQADAMIVQFRQTAESSPKNAQNWINLGDTVYDRIVSAREMIGEQSPQYLELVPRWTEAITAYTKALELEPNNWLVRADLGTSLCYQGAGTNNRALVERGLAETRKAQSQNNRDVRTLNGLAQCLTLLTPPQTDEAVKLWQQIIEIDPASRFAVNARQQIARYQR